MNDPHVIAVDYELSFASDVDYQPPRSRVTYRRPDFDVEIDGTHVRFLPQKHFSDGQSAREACEPLARAWEVEIALEVGTLGVRLKYQKTEIIDRNPTVGAIHLHAEAAAFSTVTADLTVTRSLHRYPREPDPEFLLTADAEFLWQRYRMFKEGREPLLSMAYFVLTAIEAPAGSRKNAATALNVEEKILKKIGELSSNRGDGLSARKRKALAIPLQANEGIWLERAVESLILQVGRSHAGRPLKTLTLADLPAL